MQYQLYNYIHIFLRFMHSKGIFPSYSYFLWLKPKNLRWKFPLLVADNVFTACGFDSDLDRFQVASFYLSQCFFFQYGISGPYWYAGGATIQIILFAILSIMLKTRAPGAKTFLQVRQKKPFYDKNFGLLKVNLLNSFQNDLIEIPAKSARVARHTD